MGAEYLESRQKSNSFKPNETEHYIKTKDLTQNILPAFKYQGQYLADRAKGKAFNCISNKSRKNLLLYFTIF